MAKVCKVCLDIEMLPGMATSEWFLLSAIAEDLVQEILFSLSSPSLLFLDPPSNTRRVSLSV